MSVSPKGRDIKCVVFDFDGTLVDSNPIKRDGFYAVTQDIPGASKVMDDIFSNGSPGDRHAIFCMFVERVNLAPGTDKELAEAYSKYCFDEILNCNYMKGVKSALDTLSELDIDMYVNSATPQDALRDLVGAMEIAPYFKGVYGRPLSKDENLSNIFAAADVNAHQTIVVGDGKDDADSAISTGCGFVPVFEARAIPTGTQKLDDLSALPTFLSLS